MSKVAEILEAMAANAGRAQLARGALIGGTIADVSQLPAVIANDRDKAKLEALKTAQVQQQMGLEASRGRREDQLATSAQAQAAKEQQTQQHLSAIIGAGFSDDPSKFNQDAANKKAMDLGRADLIPTVAAVHEKLQPKLTSGAPGSVMRDEQGQVVPGSQIPDKKPDYTINGQRFSGDGTPLGAVQPTQTAPKGFQSENEWQVDGKSTPVIFDPSTGARYLSQADVDAKKPIDPSRLKKIPPASVQVNAGLVGGANQEASAAEKAIGDYKMPPPSPRSLATPGGKAMMDRILAYNPDFDATQFPNRNKTRQAFTTGTQGQQVNAMNTAIGHLDQLGTAIAGLDNSDVQVVNTAKNWIATQLGGAATTNFDTLKVALSGELASVLKKSGATDAEIKSVESTIASKNSPKQLAGYVQTQIPILGSKLNALNYQYHQAMGEKDPFQALSPEAKGVLTKNGFDPDNPQIGTKPTTGKTYTLVNGKWVAQ